MKPDSKYILVTGGAGYIGSHSTIEIVNAGYNVVILDNLYNASRECVKRIEHITSKDVPLEVADLMSKEQIRAVFEKYQFTHVIHFAGLKAVGESCVKPLMYYQNNLIGTMNLLEVMREFEVYNIVFSSSATVYGDPKYLPLNEVHPTGGCTNPYGKTKHFIEEMMSDLSSADDKWNVILLRYFNPVGAHKSGLIGEDPQGPPNNLMPYVSQVAVGRREKLIVYGDDYDTPDGTGIRDYIHVVDLALGHLAALKKLSTKCGCKVYNLGTGKGQSVYDMVKAFERACDKPIPHERAERRPGDIAEMYACPERAAAELGWTATRSVDEMCEDLWRWQSMNPEGFNTSATNGHN